MVPWLIAVPAFIKVSLIFVLILTTYRFVPNLGFSILIYSLVLLGWTGTGMHGCMYQVSSFALPENYLLPVVVVLLLFFTEALGKSGRMERTITSMKSLLHSRRILYAGLPGLVGLLPMPGGALVSAPMVDAVDQTEEFDKPHKVAINYWFRHIWEYWWPLYPGVILAMRYSELPVWLYYVVQMPFTIAAFAGGYFFILRKIPRESDEKADTGASATIRAALSAVWPILLLVIISILGPLLLPRFGVPSAASSLTAMLLGIFIAVAIIFAKCKTAFRPSLRLFSSAGMWSMILLVVAIQIFSADLRCPLDANGMTLVAQMRDEFIGMGVPLILVIMAVPFIAGAVTGVAFGFVGASFPIVMALLGAHPSVGTVMATTALAYSFGYIGMMLSPMHVCFVVTNEYFKATLLRAYRWLWGPAAVVLLFALGWSSFFYFVIGRIHR